MHSRPSLLRNCSTSEPSGRSTFTRTAGNGSGACGSAAGDAAGDVEAVVQIETECGDALGITDGEARTPGVNPDVVWLWPLPPAGAKNWASGAATRSGWSCCSSSSTSRPELFFQADPNPKRRARDCPIFAVWTTRDVTQFVCVCVCVCEVGMPNVYLDN